jgi:DUF1680 family protein
MLPLILLFVLASATPAQEWKDKPVVDTRSSPKAVLHGVPISAVTLGDGFWTPRRKVNVDVSLPTLLELFEQKGVMDNFRRISGRKDVARKGPLYTDSDVYKWLEAVAYVLQSGEQPELHKSAEAVIDDVVAAQEPSGYINTYYSKERLELRHKEMARGHELYCLGHMLQAGIAWYHATGDRKLLNASQRMADYLIGRFGPDKLPIFEGHPEAELAVIELFRVTRERRYLEAAEYLLGGDERNLKSLTPRDLVYLFTGKPFTSRKKLEGHAVRAMYACSGATDLYLETGDPSYWKTLQVLWEDLTLRKMYLTGGVGSRATGEAFGEPYELPNQQAYTESCAAIGTMFWNWRMLQATGDAKYMDLFERALYNGANSGLSLSGNLYCYRNPLELTGNPEDRIRNPWYDTTCCPPNLQRILASLPGYFYSTSKDGVYVHLYHAGTMRWSLETGTPIEITQQTRYPWNGDVEFTVSPKQPAEFTLYLRIPDWARGAVVKLPGESPQRVGEAGYFAAKRTWKAGDRVTLNMSVAPRLTAAHAYVRENLAKVAVERGPLVYCMEGIDQQGSVFDWALADPATLRDEWRADLLGGVMSIRAPARRFTPLASAPLYQNAIRSAATAGEITLIPYYTFANREPASMQVWIPVQRTR